MSITLISVSGEWTILGLITTGIVLITAAAMVAALISKR